MKKVKNKLFFPAVLMTVFSVDQFMKVDTSVRAAGRKKAYKNDPESKLGKKVTLRYSQNKGAALRVGSSYPAFVKILSVVICLAATLIYIVTLGMGGRLFLKTGLSLLLGGAYSNTYDRLKYGFVTDYVSFNFGPEGFRNIVFNIADFAIMIGSALSLIR